MMRLFWIWPKALIIIWLSIVLMWMPGAVRATTYYVSTSGQDTSPGTSPGFSWATLARVNVAPIQAGDSILLQGGGIFQGGLILSAAMCGTPAQPVYIGSYGSGAATIMPPDSLHGIYVHNGAGIEIAHLNITGSGIYTHDRHGVLFYTDQPGNSQYAYIYLHDLTVSGFNRGGITLANDEITQQGYRDVTITYASVHHCGDHGIKVVGYFAETGTYYSIRQVYIAHCEAYQNPGEVGMSTGHTGSGIVVGNTDSVMIEYCLAYGNGAGNTYPYGGPVGIWVWDCRAAIIQHCESYGNVSGSDKDGGGFDIDGGCRNAILQYNYSHDNEGAGFLVAQFSDARIMRHVTVRYNVSENDALAPGHGALSVYQGGNRRVDSVFFYNNTVFLGPDAGAGSSAVRLARAGATIQYIWIANNILITTNSARLVDISYQQPHHYMWGNLYHNQAGTHLYYQLGPGTDLFTSLGAWRTARGQELVGGQPTGIQADPLLSGPGTGDTIGDPLLLPLLAGYTPTPGAPGTDAGLDMAGLLGLDVGTRDFYGSPINAPYVADIGAAEWIEVPLSATALYLADAGATGLHTSWAGFRGPVSLRLIWRGTGDAAGTARVDSISDQAGTGHYVFLPFRSGIFQAILTDADGITYLSNLVQTQHLTHTVRIGPVPFDQVLTVSLPSDLVPGSIPTLLTLQGQPVPDILWTHEDQTWYMIPAPGLAPGMYLLRLASRSGTTVHRIIYLPR